jgi:hypothetical protein
MSGVLHPMMARLERDLAQSGRALPAPSTVYPAPGRERRSEPVTAVRGVVVPGSERRVT